MNAPLFFHAKLVTMGTIRDSMGGDGIEQEPVEPNANNSIAGGAWVALQIAAIPIVIGILLIVARPGYMKYRRRREVDSNA